MIFSFSNFISLSVIGWTLIGRKLYAFQIWRTISNVQRYLIQHKKKTVIYDMNKYISYMYVYIHIGYIKRSFWKRSGSLKMYHWSKNWSHNFWEKSVKNVCHFEYYNNYIIIINLLHSVYLMVVWKPKNSKLQKKKIKKNMR